MDKVVTVITWFTHLLDPCKPVLRLGLCVLFASVTLATLNLVPARTLSADKITLVAGGACDVAGTEGAAFGGESIVVLLALVTLRADNARSAEALAGEDVTGGVEGALGVAVAILAAFPAADIPESVTTGVAVLPNDVGLALAFARVGVADGQLVYAIVVLVRVVSSQWVALAHIALLLLQASRHKSISIKTGLASLTVET